MSSLRLLDHFVKSKDPSIKPIRHFYKIMSLSLYECVYIPMYARVRKYKIKNALQIINGIKIYIKRVITTRKSCYLISMTSIRSKVGIHKNRLRHFSEWYALNHSASSSKLFSYNRTASSALSLPFVSPFQSSIDSNFIRLTSHLATNPADRRF